MDKTWVLVADKGRARLFEYTDAAQELVEIKAWANPEGRSLGRELQADRPSRTFDRVGFGQHQTGAQQSFKDTAVERFAHDLGDELERGRVEHRYDHLVLVAPPAFLGTLGATLGKELAGCVSLRVDKNLTVLSPGEIREHLPRRLH